jgi:hypothetical protein
MATKLRVRASDHAIVSRHLDAGSALVIYPEIAAPVGWVLAQHHEGEVGFVRMEFLIAS